MIHTELVAEGFTLESVLYHRPHGAFAWYTAPNGERVQREVMPADEVEVSREYVEVDHCRSCFEPARVWRTTYADGRTSESKCGWCYR
jgi:hypothetical protein